MTKFHIYPTDEEDEHELEGYYCRCEPTAKYDNETGDMLIVHNSYDGRELLEQAREILYGKNTNGNIF